MAKIQPSKMTSQISLKPKFYPNMLQDEEVEVSCFKQAIMDTLYNSDYFTFVRCQSFSSPLFFVDRSQRYKTRMS